MSYYYASTQRSPLPHSHQDFHHLELTAGTSTLMVKAEEEAMRAAMMASFMLMMLFVDYFWCGNNYYDNHYCSPSSSLTSV
jgi:hypothetical protein